MPFQLSPGVAVVEKDYTSIVPAVSTSQGGFAGVFQWGPILDPVNISSENVLTQRFGGPNDTPSVYRSFYTAANFLGYTNSCLTIRIDGADYATASVLMPEQAIKIKNRDEYYDNYVEGGNGVGAWAAKYPGSLGNSLGVSVADSSSYATWTYKTEFDGAPGTSDYAESLGAENDELHIVVYDTKGLWSNRIGTVLEKFAYVSKASDGRKGDGTNSYYKYVINETSRYIWWMDHPTPNGYAVVPTNQLSILGTVGQFSCYDETTIVDLQIGDVVKLTGSIPTFATQETGAIQSYISGTEYLVSAITTNSGGLGTEQFTLTNLDGSPVYTTPGFVRIVDPVDEPIVGLTIEKVVSSAIMENWGTPANIAGTPTSYQSMGGTTNDLLIGGSDDFAPTDGDYETGFGILANAELYDVSLIPCGAVSSTVANYVIENVAMSRMDCMAFVSPNYNGAPIVGSGSDQADQCVSFRNSLTSTSYASLDSGWKYQYDRYNDQYRWIPLNGDIAGLCARTDFTNDPWFSPGGYNRGQIKNVVKLGFNPGKTERDTLYKNGVNPVVSFPGQGTILYGDKTLLAKPSAFDRINVRRLFIVLEKAIAIAAKYQLFEFNDAFTRAQFRNIVEPFLRDVQGRRGIIDFVVKCDDSNNTGEVIDRNEFIADIFIKPARSINFITLNFIAARTSVNFSEIGG